MARNYSNVAEETTLSTGINSSATSITVGSNTGYPSVPYTIIIDPGLATEEVCEVTAVVGTTWTITRGVDGTPASSHDTGATVVHGYSARDLRDIQDHIGDSTGIHGLGVSSSVVGTTDTQTMTNKTLTSPTINGGTLNGVTLGAGLTLDTPILNSPTIANYTNAQHTHEDAASGGALGGSASSVAYKRTGSGTMAIDYNEDGTQGNVVRLSTLAHSIGNATWTTANTNSRIILPSDIASGYWSVSAGMRVTGAGATGHLLLVHEVLGIIAQQSYSMDDLLGGIPLMSMATDFQSDASKWLELRIGAGSGSYTGCTFTAYMAIHRIA